MKTLLLAICLGACLNLAQAQYNRKNLALEPVATQSRYKYKNLQLFPIRAKETFHEQHQHVGNYITLKDALEKKKIAVTEQGSVNTLFIENVSSDTIMILAGEVVKGGKQDRMIGQDVILYPRSGKKDVSVFCVEQGRWQENGNGKSFTQYYSISNKEVRKAATVQKNQNEVWNKVAETTGKHDAKTSTGTLTALNNSGAFKKELQAYTEHYASLMVSESDVIGVVAVSGNEVLGCDMFATHDLFKKHYSNLVTSYAAEAITSGEPVTISYQSVSNYLDELIGDEAKQEQEVQKKGTMLKDKERKLHISTF